MKIVSLFSGAGGLDLGFLNAGHEVVWANDCYGDAVSTYMRNIGKHIIGQKGTVDGFSFRWKKRGQSRTKRWRDGSRRMGRERLR